MIPKFVKKYLWSNYSSEINLKEDYKRIILILLNIGSKDATDWLFKQYSRETIKNVIIECGAFGELDAKSLNY